MGRALRARSRGSRRLQLRARRRYIVFRTRPGFRDLRAPRKGLLARAAPAIAVERAEYAKDKTKLASGPIRAQPGLIEAPRGRPQSVRTDVHSPRPQMTDVGAHLAEG